MRVLSPEILEKRFVSFQNFRAEYCNTLTKLWPGSRYPATMINGYRNLENLAKVVAPYVLRREKKDCLDLPPKLYTEREVALTPESWKRYCELKKDALMSLPDGNVRLEPNLAVRFLRLAQLTSGILGGNAGDSALAELSGNPEAIHEPDTLCEDLSDEKLKWCVRYLTEECTAKAVIVWTRWRRERERLVNELRETKGNHCIFQLYGGQKVTERNLAVQFFSGIETDKKPERSILIAQPHAGGHGLNLVAASEAIYLSNDFALGIRLQSEDRCHRPGQVNSVTYIDVLATGPKGQKTIDHIIFKALRDKKNVADLTCAEWRKELSEDE
jgi:SNF2 family DNA or RNA helicase